MLTLIVGGSGSGKSAYAEQYLCQQAKGQKYYLATMQVWGQEGQEKVERHRRLRAGKGFLTIEQPRSIHEALYKMKEEKSTKTACCALLECMSNLTANEMFDGEKPKSCQEVTAKILREVEELDRGLLQLVIVTNNVFEDGIPYDETTAEYIRALGCINQRLAQMADRVIEVVVGIAVDVK